MKRSFLVAFDVAGEEAEASPAAASVRRISVIASFAAGWAFLFTKGYRLVARLWLPAALLALWDAGGLGSASSTQALVESWTTMPALVVNLALNALIVTGAYSLAEGVMKPRAPDSVTLAELRLGFDDLRVFLAKLVLWLVVIILAVGSILIGRQVLSWLSNAGFLVQLTRAAGETGMQWAKDLDALAWIALMAPIVLAGIILVWLATRYALVFAHVIAVGRMKIFDALALTKGNSWRILVLWLLLALSILVFLTVIIFGIAVIVQIVHQGPHTLNYAGGGDGLPRQFSHTLRHHGPQPQSFLPYVPWAAAGAALIWQSVFAGAFAHVYRRVTGAI